MLEGAEHGTSKKLIEYNCMDKLKNKKQNYTSRSKNYYRG